MSVRPDGIYDVEAGEDIVIARNGKPVARLVAVAGTNSLAAVRGVWRGRVRTLRRLRRPSR